MRFTQAKGDVNAVCVHERTVTRDLKRKADRHESEDNDRAKPRFMHVSRKREVMSRETGWPASPTHAPGASGACLISFESQALRLSRHRDGEQEQRGKFK